MKTVTYNCYQKVTFTTLPACHQQVEILEGITERHNPSSTCISTAGTDGQETFLNWTLMGSSSDRLQLRKEQHNELEKSLKVDQEKEALNATQLNVKSLWNP